MPELLYHKPDMTRQYLSNIGFERRLLYLFFAGLCLGLSSPGFNQGYLAWFGFIPFFVLLRSCANYLEAILIGSTFGFAYSLVSLSYFLNFNNNCETMVEAIVSFGSNVLYWCYVSLTHSLVFVVYAVILYLLPLRTGFIPWYKRPYYPYLLTAPLLWIYLNDSPLSILIPIKNCLTSIALSQYLFEPVNQITKLAGRQIIDFFIILVNCSISNLIIQNFPLTKRFGQRIDSLKDDFGSVLDNLVILLILFTVYTGGQLGLNESIKNNKLAMPDEPVVNTLDVCARLIGETKIDNNLINEEIKRYLHIINLQKDINLFVCPEGNVYLPDKAKELKPVF